MPGQFWISASLLALLTLPAMAEVKIERIQVFEQAPGSSTRRVEISLLNPTSVDERLNTLQLQFRGPAGSQWLTAKSWNEPVFMPSGQTMVIDLDCAPDSQLFQALQTRHYELQALAHSQALPTEPESAER